MAIAKTTRATAPAKKEPAPAAKKKFFDTDMISCMSITPGELLVVGDKTKDLYDWLYDGDVVDVSYGDLMSMVRTHNINVYGPRFVIQNDEFLAEHKDIADLYVSLYSPNDLRQILSLPVDQMRSVIQKLPDVAKEAIKNFASAGVDNRTFDSVNAVKVIDELFGTSLLTKITM